jgi:Protein of unknown function (DUF3775)
MPELRISPEKVCFVVMRARQIEAKEVGGGLGDGSNPSDQGIDDEAPDIDALDADLDDATEMELRDAIASFNEDETLDLIALMRLGRDDAATLDDWDEILAEVAASQDTPAADYLLGTPLLSEYLEEGLDKFGLRCTDVESALTWPPQRPDETSGQDRSTS